MRAIARECRRRGLRVVAMPGWETRGLGRLDPRHVICHHTAAARDVDRLLRDGRADLRGPLCNFALHADGAVVLTAAGRANHAGRGIIPSSAAYGIEATGPPFPNYDAYVQLCAAIRAHHGWGADRVVAHKETARPRGRKIDPSFDMGTFRADVSSALSGSSPARTKQEDDMPFTEAQLKRLFKEVLDEGTGHGQKNWAGTSKATLKVVQDVVNDTRTIRAEAAAIKAALVQAGSGTVDLDAVMDAARRGAAQALAEASGQHNDAIQL
jgi:hypothetical protein